MHGLHGGDDTELGEAREVVVVEDLRVLDAKAVVGRRHLAEGRRISAKREALAPCPRGAPCRR